MEKNMKMLSLADALRDGVSLEDIRKSFETALQDAQNEVAAEKKAQEAKDCDESDLELYRKEMVYVILDYLTALGFISEDMEVDDNDIDRIIDILKGIEEEYKAKLGFMKILSSMNKMEVNKREKVGKKSSADDIIAQFLKGLH